MGEVTTVSLGRPFGPLETFAGLSGVVTFPPLAVCESFRPRHQGMRGRLSRRAGFRIASSVGNDERVPNVSPLRTVSDALTTEPDRARTAPPNSR